MMENVIVEFEEDREVIIDDQQNGRTNQNLNIGAGQHTFTLGDPKNFSPLSITTVVAGTSVIEPKVISFGVDHA